MKLLHRGKYELILGSFSNANTFKRLIIFPTGTLSLLRMQIKLSH